MLGSIRRWRHEMSLQNWMRPGRIVVIINILGIFAVAAPLAVAWFPLHEAREATREARTAADDAAMVQDHLVVVAEYGATSDSALRVVESGDTGGLDVVLVRLLELGTQMREVHPRVEQLAEDRGHTGTAARLRAAGDALTRAAERAVPAFGTPGVGTGSLRIGTKAAVADARDNTDALATALESDAAEASERASAATQRAIRGALIAVVIAGTVMSAITITFRRRLLVDERSHRAIEAVRDAEAARTAFEMQLRGGLDMSTTEAEAYNTLERGLAEAAPELGADVLMADSSRTHFELVASHRSSGCTGCPVSAPGDCPALRRGHVLTFESSEALDACPHLRGRPEGEVSAVCIPMSIGSQTEGVLHASVPGGDVPGERVVALLETVARASSDRLGMLRAMARSEAQASTDPLTGLLNRRSFDDRAHALLRQKVPFTVAFADLDHFKRLNDLHGHDTGDRALRLFSRILSLETRPNDVVSRYGGEEFVVVLPRCDPEAALAVLARVRHRLAEQIPGANLPHFTVSFGLCAWDGASDLRTVIARADEALLLAKERGRDRDEVAEPDSHPDPDGRLAVVPVAVEEDGADLAPADDDVSEPAARERLAELG